jgi:hypothetical protein
VHLLHLAWREADLLEATKHRFAAVGLMSMPIHSR